MVFYLYVVDDRRHLVGVCSLRELLLAEPGAQLSAIMSPSVTAVNTATDQEDVARLVARYDLLALPVVDDENKLVGIITVDDVIDIIRDEETEDMLLMAGLGEGDEEEVLRAPVWKNALQRFPWLLAAFAGGIAAWQIYESFAVRLGPGEADSPSTPRKSIRSSGCSRPSLIHARSVGRCSALNICSSTVGTCHGNASWPVLPSTRNT